jgi:hypothetical protein
MRQRFATLLLVLLVLGVLALERAWPPSARAQGSDLHVRPMGSFWNAAAPVASTNLFATNLQCSTKAANMRIAVVLKVTGVFYLVETNGTTTQVYALNGGTALNAFQAYTFTWGLRKTDEASPANTLGYNFQLGSSTNGGIAVLRVDEIDGGVD